MASYSYLGRRESCSSGFLGHGYSKAQFNLWKILHLISTIPPTPKLEEMRDFSISTGNLELDLNLKLGPPSELGDSESFAENETDSAAVGSNVQRSASHVLALQEMEEEEEEVVVEKSVDVSQVIDSQHVQVESFECVPAGTGRLGGHQRNVKRNEEDIVDDDSSNRVEAAAFTSKRHIGKEFVFGSGGGARSYNCNHDGDGFELLIKAAKLISGGKNEFDSEEQDEERCRGNELSGQVGTGTSKKRGSSSSSGNHSMDCCVDLEENSPVVRSKRGRNQSLPYRYRDSVMEPLKRSGSGRQPQRLSSTTVSRKQVCPS